MLIKGSKYQHKITIFTLLEGAPDGFSKGPAQWAVVW